MFNRSEYFLVKCLSSKDKKQIPEKVTDKVINISVSRNKFSKGMLNENQLTNKSENVVG